MSPIKTVISLLLIIPAIALLAFGPRADQDAPADRVIVEYWEKWTGTEEEQMRQIVDAFNKTEGAERKIFVRYMSTSNVQQKTLIATAAGVPPDIAGLFDGNLVQFAALGALEPLEDDAPAMGVTADSYKKVYWDACHYNGHLWATISTPAVIALHYNRVAFLESADKLRAAGLDPNRPPQTIDELDRYAEALTIWKNKDSIARAGYFPMEPGWYIQYSPFWFGSDLWDAKTGKFLLTTPRVIKAFHWIQSYADKFGSRATDEFKGGMSNFDSPQNAFLTGKVLMEQQGPWMANMIEHQAPQLNRLPGSPPPHAGETQAERRARCAWAVAPFPTDDPNIKDLSYATFDTFCIPRGAKHKKEALVFMAYVNRQDVMEKLCSMHCKNSPLKQVSREFVENHPNPYIDVFERLASSPNAMGPPQIPILPEVAAEVLHAAQIVNSSQATPEAALSETQARLQTIYDDYLEKQAKRAALQSSSMN